MPLTPGPSLMPAEQSAVLVEFARACRTAARSVSLYPATHPSIQASLQRVIGAAGRLAPAGHVTLAVHPGALFIDDVRIPQDETKFTPGLGQVSFRPGPEKEIKSLAPGHHYATIHFWPQDKGDEDAARAAGVVKSYTWQFTAG